MHRGINYMSLLIQHNLKPRINFNIAIQAKKLQSLLMDDVLLTRRTRNLNSKGTNICTRIADRRLKRDSKIQFNYEILKFVITNHKSSDSHLSRSTN